LGQKDKLSRENLACMFKSEHHMPLRLSLANSVNYWRHFCLFRDSQDGGSL